jgi:hypothetical protein
MKGLATFVKGKGGMGKAIVYTDAKAEKPEEANGEWKLPELKTALTNLKKIEFKRHDLSRYRSKSQFSCSWHQGEALESVDASSLVHSKIAIETN